tara:strand:- start:192 stop:1148 length:957 start_codon:yes stop_codon:yes gene_type:complete
MDYITIYKMTENKQLIDLLDEDKPVANQKFVCVSFVSPENILKQKQQFMFEEFAKHWDLKHNMQKFTEFMNFISYKYNLKFDNVMTDLDEYVKSEQDNLRNLSINDDYKTFLDNHEDQLTEEFKKKFSFQTSVRGLKIRGSYPTQQEAELRCKMLREVDPNHDVYVGPVGMWMPWEPEAYKTGRVEYLEEELNKLMHEKQKNETSAKEAFDARVKETKKQAIEDNIKKAKESGNKLTQTLNEEGELVNVANMITQENSLLSGNGKEVTSDQVKEELFEGDNVLTASELKNSDHGLSEVLERRKKREQVKKDEITDDVD